MNAHNIIRCMSINALVVLQMSLCLPALAENEWNTSAEKDGIQTFLRKIEGSKYKAVRGETILPVDVAKLVAVINDAQACPEWADLCAKSFIHQQPSANEAFIYTLNDMPWPVKDREVLAHVVWSKNAQGQVKMLSNAVAGKIEKKKGVVRIEHATAMWHFTPLENGSTHTVFEIHMDPNGAIPGWLLNRLVVKSPFTTFKSLAKQAAKAKYNDATLPF